MKRKWIKYTVRAVILCLCAWILVLAIVYFYIKNHKEKIMNAVKAEIGQKITGQFEFDDLSVDFLHNFPSISVDLKNVHVRDSLYSIHKHELLTMEHVYIGFNLFDIIRGRKTPKSIALVNGQIFLFSDSTGRQNWNVINSKPSNSGRLVLDKANLTNVDAIFEDDSKFKYYEILFVKMKCTLHRKDNLTQVAMNSQSIIRNASFSTKMGSYLSNKSMYFDWDLSYDSKLKTITLPDQSVRFNRQWYRVSGHFIFGDDPRFDLAIDTRNLTLSEGASIFPAKTEKKINRFKLSKPLLRVQAFLSGPMKYLSFPVAKIYFSVNDATLGVSQAQFDHCGFKVFLNNMFDTTKQPSDYNTVLQFTDVKGIWEKNSFDAKKVFVYNVIKPYLDCDIHFVFKLTQLDKAIASRRLDLNGGEGEAQLNYSGPIGKFDTTYNLEGTINIRNGDITYNPRNLDFKNTDMELVFQNGDMQVRKMNTEINNNKIRINGDVKGVLRFFNSDSAKTNFEWNIYSPYLDINKITSSLHRSASAKKKEGYSFFDKLNNKIDRLFDDCNAYLNIRADKLLYKNFVATAVSGKLTLRNDMIGVNDFSLKHAGGTIELNASSKDNGRNSDIMLQSRMQNVNVKELFNAFNNFGMESLTSKNINGVLSAEINLTSVLDANNDLYRPANKGYVDFILEDGKLENFQPLVDIDNNFLQKRDLSHISFAELKDRLEINGNDIKVNRMEIKSTAVNMYVEGTYSFTNNTDLSIQIPLLKQNKNATEVPEKKGNNSKGGISVFLRAKDDKDGKLKIGYDLLGRFRNKK